MTPGRARGSTAGALDTRNANIQLECSGAPGRGRNSVWGWTCEAWCRVRKAVRLQIFEAGRGVVPRPKAGIAPDLRGGARGGTASERPYGSRSSRPDETRCRVRNAGGSPAAKKGKCGPRAYARGEVPRPRLLLRAGRCVPLSRQSDRDLQLAFWSRSRAMSPSMICLSADFAV